MNDNPFSFQNTMQYLNRNFGLLLLLAVVASAGFFFGSVWTEREMGASTSKTANTGTAQPQAAAPAAEGDNALTLSNLVAKAKAVGVNEAKVKSCIESGEMTQKVKDQMNGGSQAGVSGTPGTIVVVDGVPTELISGALPFDDYTGQDGNEQPGVRTIVEKYVNGTAGANANAALANMPAVTADDNILGNENARIVLVEYSDFECPFCGRFHPTAKQVLDEFGDSVALVYRHFPLSFHPNAQQAAEASECVAKEGGNEAFWSYADSLFES